VSEVDVGAPPVGNTLTELVAPTFTNITAAASAPIPLVVTAADASAIGAGEPLEGVLVQTAHLKVTAIGLLNQVTLTDDAGATIIMDDDIFANYGGTVDAPTLPAVGDCFDTLTGVMSLQLTADIRTINPRSASDLVAGTCCQ
jgi:hypothetical protein